MCFYEVPARARARAHLIENCYILHPSSLATMAHRIKKLYMELQPLKELFGAIVTSSEGFCSRYAL